MLLVIVLVFCVTPAFSMTRQEFAEVAKRAGQGDPEAQYTLGEVYNGEIECEGVKENASEAMRWYLKAAELGHAAAQNSLGVLYYDGRGVNRDYNKAFDWYLKSAKQNYHWGQYNVGDCYYNGTGVKKNRSEAMKWYELAANQGNQMAKEAISSYKTEQIGTLVLGGLLLGGLAYLMSGSNNDRAVNNNDTNDYFSALSGALEKATEQENTKEVFQCGDCNGTGKCSNCNGTGEILEVGYQFLSGQPYDDLQRMPCPVCWRPGVCKRCEGSGKIDTLGNAVQ